MLARFSTLGKSKGVFKRFLKRTPTLRAIGEWLEYRKPENALTLIIRRNPHIKPFSVSVRLTSTDGKEYETEKCIK